MLVMWRSGRLHSVWFAMALCGAAAVAGATAAGTRDVRAANFEDVVVRASERRTIVVEFYADWCGYCRQLAPILRSLDKAYGGQLHFVRLDIDREPEVAERLKVRGVPTLVVFDEGVALNVISGLVSEQELRSVLDAYVREEPR